MKRKKRKYYRLSKFLSLILRHKPQILHLELDEEGFIDCSLKRLSRRLREKKGFEWVTEEDIEEVVKNDKKGRYEIKENKIRATYGHSVPVKLLSNNNSERIPDILYHGTSPSAGSLILKKGLKSKNRVYVHLSEDIETAYAVGKRHSEKPVILKINAKELLEEGQDIKKVGKGIYITKDVPAKYITEVLPQLKQ